MRRLALSLGLLTIAAALAGCGSSTSSGTPTRTEAPPTTTAATTAATTTGSGGGELTLRVYLLQDGHVAPVARAVPRTQAVARAALEQLLAGPTAAELAHGLTTQVPSGVALRGLTIAGGHATADFDTSFGQGDQASVSARLAQVVFTLTQFPSVHSVSVETGGQPLGQPATRADYERLSPLILVESPLPGQTVTSPLHVSGTANVFEATFQLEVQDDNGAVLWKHFVTASTGAPERGTFDVTVTLPSAAAGPISVVVYDENQANGQREHEVVVPVLLAR